MDGYKGGVAYKAPAITLEPRSSNGEQPVPAGSYTLLVPANPKRRWLRVKVPKTEADPMLVCLCRGEPAVRDFGNFILDSGESILFSMDGDMPWQGAVYGIGILADTACYWIEVEDFP